MIRVLDRTVEAIACALLVALLLTVLAGVVTRAADAPLIWTDEGARFLMVWLACFGAIVAGRRRAHVRIRFFQGLLAPAAFRAVEILIQLGVVGLGAAIAVFAVALVRRNAGLEATSLPIAMAWLYVPLLPLGAAIALQGLGQVFEAARRTPVLSPAAAPRVE